MFTFPVGFLAQDDPYTQNDPYWNNVSLLLPMTGTNGSTTFTDYSPSPKTISTNGNSQISTAQSVFGEGSALFDGNGDYLTAPTGTAFQFPGDFTVECFSRFSSVSRNNIILDTRTSGSNTGIIVYCNSSGQIIFFADGGNRITGSTLLAGTFYYIAARRSGSTSSLWVDGIQVGGNYISATNYSDGGCFIGSGWDLASTFQMFGNLSHLRITKGIARDVSVVPTAPFPIG